MSQTVKGTDSSKPLDRLVTKSKNLVLAGVGAVAEVREGSLEMFDRLVERGKPLEAKQRKAAKAVVNRATKAVRGAGQLVQDTVEFESRGLLQRLNVMTREDVKVLSARISTLSKKVDELVARRHAPTAGVVPEKTPKMTPEMTPKTPIAAADVEKTAEPRQRKTASTR